MRIRTNILAAALCMGTAALSAQQADNGFRPHWYLQLQAGASQTPGVARADKLVSPAAAFYAGYRFSPLWGARIGASGWEAKGSLKDPRSVYEYNFVQADLDLTLDLSSLFCGYNACRTFSSYAFAGVGLNRAFNNDQAAGLVNVMGAPIDKYWGANETSFAGRFGLGADIRLWGPLSFNIEANANLLPDKYNQKSGAPDWQFNLMGGFTLRLGGKACRKAEPVSYTPTPAPAPAPVKEEPAPTPVVKEEPAPAPAPAPKAEPLRRNIFFAINSSVIRSSEQAKIDELVKYLNEHPQAKVGVSSYADRQTGNAAINRRISDARSRSVAQALREKGIAEERIHIDAWGDTVQPFGTAEENRVSICVAE